jgi:predicted MFS family arabinose efflux permease
VWQILSVSFLNSLVMTFDQPARQALVSDLVEGEDLVNAIALNSMAFNGAAVFGPSLGGLLLATIGAPGCFFVNGVSFLAVIGALARMEVPPEKRDRLRGQGGLRREIAEGLAVVQSSRSLAGLLFLIAALSFFGRPYNQLMPVFAKDVLRVGPRGLGLLMAAPGIGTVIGSLALASAGPKLNLGRLSIAAALTFSAALAGFSRLRFFPLNLAFLTVVGMGQTVAMAATNTILQTSVEPGLRGRVISMYTMLNMGLNPLGTLFGGALAASWGAPAVVCGGGVVVAAVAFFVAYWAWEITGLPMAGMRQHPPEGLRPSGKNKDYN